jgi:integration host factor subunit beta
MNLWQLTAEMEAISMTKADLIQRLADKTKMSVQRAELLVDSIFACMEMSLHRGERIEIRGFGTFQVRSYKGYEGRNPKTGDAVQVAPKRLPFFKASQNLAAKINEAARRTMSMKMMKITPPAKQAPLRDPKNQVGSLP